MRQMNHAGQGSNAAEQPSTRFHSKRQELDTIASFANGMVLAAICAVMTSIAHFPAHAAELLQQSQLFSEISESLDVPVPGSGQGSIMPILEGDFDGDGASDVLIMRSPDQTNPFPRIESISTATGGVLYTINSFRADDLLGMAQSAGDVNSDGFDDIMINVMRPDVADPSAMHTLVKVYSGLDGSEIHSFSGEADFDGFGMSLAPAGDVNGDGCDDIIIGAPLHNAGHRVRSGRAYVFSGSTGEELFRFDGSVADMGFGASVAGLGDLDNDNLADIAVSGPGANAVFVYSGGSGQLLYSVIGQIDKGFGWSIASADDFDGDGYAELLISEPFAFAGIDPETGGSLKGWVHVYSGRTGAFIRSVRGRPGEYFGTAVSGLAEDLDGDNVGDMLVGSNATGDPTDIGLVAVVVASGVSGDEILRVQLDDLMDGGQPVQGDLDGDGAVDMADVVLCIEQFSASRGDYGATADINNDGQINSLDLELVLARVGVMPDESDGALPVFNPILCPIATKVFLIANVAGYSFCLGYSIGCWLFGGCGGPGCYAYVFDYITIPSLFIFAAVCLP